VLIGRRKAVTAAGESYPKGRPPAVRRLSAIRHPVIPEPDVQFSGGAGGADMHQRQGSGGSRQLGGAAAGQSA
jgi:hypothetical protein